jgi:regulatory protein
VSEPFHLDLPGSDAVDDGPAQPELATVMRLATRYLARYAASSHHLRQVLTRQVRRYCERRGIVLSDPQVISALIDAAVARLTELGAVDDETFARARARHFVRKGLPAQQVQFRLASEGLGDRVGDLDDVIVDDEHVQARRYAERKRLGPFRRTSREGSREKDMRSLIRAGFPPRVAAAVIDGPGEDGSPDQGS